MISLNEDYVSSFHAPVYAFEFFPLALFTFYSTIPHPGQINEAR